MVRKPFALPFLLEYKRIMRNKFRADAVFTEGLPDSVFCLLSLLSPASLPYSGQQISWSLTSGDFVGIFLMNDRCGRTQPAVGGAIYWAGGPDLGKSAKISQ